MESRATEIPSVWAVAFGASVVAGLAGYFLGTASSIGVFGNSSQKRVVSSSEKGHDDSDSDDANASDSELEDSEDDQEVNGFEDSTEECKLVLVVRTDLGMTKGTYRFFFAINQHHTPSVSPLFLRYLSIHTLRILSFMHSMPRKRKKMHIII